MQSKQGDKLSFSRQSNTKNFDNQFSFLNRFSLKLNYTQNISSFYFYGSSSIFQMAMCSQSSVYTRCLRKLWEFWDGLIKSRYW